MYVCSLSFILHTCDLFLSLGLLCVMYVDFVLYFLSLGLIYVTLHDVMFCAVC